MRRPRTRGANIASPGLTTRKARRECPGHQSATTSEQLTIEEVSAHVDDRVRRDQESAAWNPLPVGVFGTILVDPPWRFSNRSGRVSPEHRRLWRYSTVATEDITSLPIGAVAAPNSHLYLWVPNALLA